MSMVIRIVVLAAFLLELVIGALLLVITPGGIHVGPYPGPEPLSPVFQLVGLALVCAGLGGLGGLGEAYKLNPQPEVPSARMSELPANRPRG
jgi:hypothetical protein